MHAAARPRRRRTAAIAGLVLGLLAVGGAPLRAQGPPPDGRWYSFTTEHFRVTYPEGLEALARHAAERGEVAHALLSAELVRPPRGRVELVLTDHTDFSNGFATPLPSNRITLFAKPPVDHPVLAYHHDWIDLVLVHELAHIFHLDLAGPLGRAVRSVFGRVPLPWPAFPAWLTPTWSIEGLATLIESRATGFGRVAGTIHEMVLRTAILEDAFETIDQASGTSPVWPGGNRPYIYGSLFLEHLIRTHGPDAVTRMVEATARNLLPPPLFFDEVGRSATGRTFTAEWAAWRSSLEERYAGLVDSLAVRGLTAPRRLTGHGHWAIDPRVSPDGRTVAYTADTGREVAATVLLDPETGATRAIARRSQFGGVLGPASWFPAGDRLLTAQLEYVDPYRIYSDLYIVGAAGGEQRLTRGARLQEPDVSPDGRTAVAIQHEGGATRPVLVDLDGGAIRPLAPFDLAVNWSSPRWAPDGRRFAVARWSHGGWSRIMVLDLDGRPLADLGEGHAIDAAPAWSPDGRFLLFGSDRTGIPNLFAAELGADSHTIHQITNVATGAFKPEVSPDGRWIYFSVYHADGYHIARIPFEPAGWLTPGALDPRFATTAAVHGRAHGHGPPPGETPVVGSPARRFSPLPSALPTMWLPIIDERPSVGTFWGALTGGRDVLDRHSYNVHLAVQPGAGRFTGGLDYRFAGLGNPVLELSARRRWSGESFLFRDTIPATIIGREDVAALAARFVNRRWRHRAGLTLGAEYVASRDEIDTQLIRLLDPRDDLAGVFADVDFANTRTHAYSISRENGVALRIGTRHRRDLEPEEIERADATTVLADATNTQVHGSLAAFRAIRSFGFANHVAALRATGLTRSGPGARTVPLGGASGSPEALLPGYALGGSGIFLPVRGYAEGARRGTTAWSASAEYRLPVALIGRGYRLMPVFLDRLSASAFLDAGDAWCTAEQDQLFSDCTRWSGDHGATPAFALQTLASAGAELSLDAAFFFGPPVRLRGGFAFPFTGPYGGARAYFRLGPSF
jgi:Tol biopolymer transport system component